LRILEAVIAVNDNRKRAMACKLPAMFCGASVAKPSPCKHNTDDMRDGPSLALIAPRASWIGSRFHNAASAKCFPSHEAIADAAGCARSTVAAAIRALEQVGVLS
jgi:hypothetical protein